MAGLGMVKVVAPVAQTQLEITVRLLLPAQFHLERRAGTRIWIQEVRRLAPIRGRIAVLPQVVDQRGATPGPARPLEDMPAMLGPVPAVQDLGAGLAVVVRQRVDEFSCQ